MIVLNEEGAKRVFEKKEEMQKVLEKGLGNESTNASQMMCFRLICNSFGFFESRRVIEEMSEFIFEKIYEELFLREELWKCPIGTFEF